MPAFLIVDDHALVRRGLREVLVEGFSDARFGEAESGAGALEQLSTADWDLLLLDIHMPERSGLEILEEVRRRWPQLPVLVVSAYPEEEFAVRCLRLGAAGYVTKNSAPDELVVAVRKALQGGKYVTNTLAERLASMLGTIGQQDPRQILSGRELQVVRLVAAGRSGKEIAAELHVSEKTIATYRSRIADKLGVSTNVELTRYALQHKLVD
jgi:DNA-binding NarL/FixJ family response regulator